MLRSLLPWSTRRHFYGAFPLSLLLLQLPAPLLPWKGRTFPPQGPHHGQKQLVRRDQGFHHCTWMLQDQESQLEPLRLLRRSWPHHQPFRPALVSSVQRTKTYFTPLALEFSQKPNPNHVSEVDVRRPFMETHSWSLVSRFLYCRVANIA